MEGKDELKTVINSLLTKYHSLPNKNDEAEKRTEEFLMPLFEAMGWNRLSSEVIPQKRVKSALRTTRVDYSFRKTGDSRASFYLEAKRFSDNLEDPKEVQQALEYGKNGGIRYVILTNFTKWRVFNSDYYDEPEHAELFEFNLSDALVSADVLNWISLFSRENGWQALDAYAKSYKKWKESASVEELLTEQLIITREKLTKAIYEANRMLFDQSDGNEDITLDACVQHILDRVIFCRLLEDNGADPERKMGDVLEMWKQDRRVQFYREHLSEFFKGKMQKKYDSTIFDPHRIDGLSVPNEDFVPVLESFYRNPKTGLRYRFDVISTDVLGHAYENYLSYKVRQTAKRAGVEKELYKRKQSGIYYTPAFLVDYLVRSTLGERLKKCKTPEDALKIRVLDPACGSGTFLVRAFEEFKSWHQEYSRRKPSDAGQTRLDSESESHLSGFLDEVLEKCIYGIDLDLRAVRLASLNLFLRAVGTPKKLPRLNIIQRNSLVWEDEEMVAHRFVFERDFPLVHESGGFDIVLGNPPWEKWKPDSQEFFEQYEPGFKSLPAQEAKKKMAEILQKKISVKHAWNAKLAEYELYSEIFRRDYKWQSAEANGRSVSGDLDLYKLFTERAHMLLKKGGVCGFVVPSGIYTDLGAKGLRTMLFEQSTIEGLYSFENRKFIFADIDQRYKFVLLVFEKGGKTEKFPCAFFLHDEEDLKNATASPTILDVEFVKKSSPTSWSVLEIKTPKDYSIIQKMLKFPPLGQEISGAWNVEMSRGFDMTNDSHLFRDGKLGGIPMLEGKNIHQFTHQWKEAPTPRYTINEKDIRENLKEDKIYHTGYWMAYRLIARSTDERTFISAIIPPGYVCGNSIAIVRLPKLKELCFLSGVMNSFVVDYFLRQKVSANVNMFYFLETPVPRINSGKEFEEIARKTAQLVATTSEFEELKKEIGVKYGLTNENDRALARAQLDVLVAKLYGITKEELAYILEKFPLVDQKQKDLVLREY